MRTAFILSFVANLALTVVALLMSPSRVAIHFGPGGFPDGWAPAYVNALVISGINVLIFVSFFFVPHMLRSTPARWISLPNKQYWMREENRGRMESVLAAQLYEFGTLTFALMFMVGVLALQANLSDPVRFREGIFWWPFGLYMAYVVYWTVKIFLVFRVPKEERP